MMPDPRDVTALADAIYAEARGESRRGQLAVAHTIANRATVANVTVAQAVYARSQITGLQPGDPNRQAVERAGMADPVYARAVETAAQVLSGQTVDPTGGATYYKTREASAAWANDPNFALSATVGAHEFYTAPPREVRAVTRRTAVPRVTRADEEMAAVTQRTAAIVSPPTPAARPNAAAPSMAGRAFTDYARNVHTLEAMGTPIGDAPTPTARPAAPSMAGRAFTDYARGTDIAIGSADMSGVTPRARAMLSYVEKYSGVPSLTINSAYRNPQRNAAVGGAKNSQHTLGEAFDINLRGLSDQQKASVLRAAAAGGAKGIGIYNGGTTLHVDMRDTPTFWGTGRNRYAGMPINTAPDWARDTLQSVFDGTAARPPTPAVRPDVRSAPAPLAAAKPSATPQMAMGSLPGVARNNALARQAETPNPMASMAAGRAAERSVPVATSAPTPTARPSLDNPMASMAAGRAAERSVPVSSAAPTPTARPSPSGNSMASLAAGRAAERSVPVSSAAPTPTARPSLDNPMALMAAGRAAERSVPVATSAPTPSARPTRENPMASMAAGRAAERSVPVSPAPREIQTAAKAGDPTAQALNNAYTSAAARFAAARPSTRPQITAPSIPQARPSASAIATAIPQARPSPVAPTPLAPNPVREVPARMVAAAAPAPVARTRPAASYIPAAPTPAPTYPNNVVPTPKAKPDELSIGKVLGAVAGHVVLGGGIIGPQIGGWLGDKIAPQSVRRIAENYISAPKDIGQAVEAGYSSPDGALNSKFDSEAYWRDLGRQGKISQDTFTTSRQMAREQAERRASGQKTWGDAFGFGRGQFFDDPRGTVSSLARGTLNSLSSLIPSAPQRSESRGGGTVFGGDRGAYGVALGPSGPVMTDGRGSAGSSRSSSSSSSSSSSRGGAGSSSDVREGRRSSSPGSFADR